MPRHGILPALAALLAAGASSMSAQGLPAYLPINPVTTSRSALYFQPHEPPAPRWRATAQFDWASLIEVSTAAEAESFVLDAEVLRMDLTLVRDYGPASFVLVRAGVFNAYDGVMDEFYNWYHEVTGLKVKGREQRPLNRFAYGGEFADGEARAWEPVGLALTDVTVGAGIRNSPNLQSMLFVTLPTSTAGRGYSRGTVSVNATLTGWRQLSDRLRYEGSAGLGWTPRHGELTPFQRTTFWSVSSGLRLRFWGRQAMFFNGFYQSAGYRGTGLGTYDRAEMTGDMGFLIRPGRGAPELILALTEDLKPSGPAIDAAFRIGVRW